MDLELIEPIALEHRSPDAHHSGFQLVDGEGAALAVEARSDNKQEGTCTATSLAIIG